MKKWLTRFRKKHQAQTPDEQSSSEASFSEIQADQISQGETVGLTKNEEKESALGKVDKALLAVSVIILLSSVSLLFFDGLFSDIDDQHLTAIGEIKDSKSDVRRKVNNGMSWGNVSSGNTVYEGDSIFTGAESTAEIQLENGGLLTIDEKSLVVVRTRNGVLELDLQYGTVVGDIKSDKPVVVINNGERTELKPVPGETVRIKKQQDTIAQKVQIVSPAPPPEKAQPKFSITLLNPSLDQKIWIAENEPLEFTWKSKQTLENPKVEFSTDPGFVAILAEISGSDTSATTQSLPEADGPLYWRVRDNKNVSVPRKFYVYSDRPPIQVNPENSRELLLDDSEDSKAITFSWDDEFGAKDFKLQISSSPNFEEVLQEIKTGKKRIQSKPLAPGKYYWRVAGLHPARKSPPWSGAWSFSIHSFGKLVPPVLENPTAKYEIPSSLLQKQLAAKAKGPIAVPEEQAPQLRWKPAPKVKNYLVEIATDKDFKKSSKVRTNKTAFVLDKVAPRTIHWRVSSVDANGKFSEPSASGEMAITVPAPKLQSMKPINQKFKDKKELDAAKAATELTWTPVPTASGYEIEAGKDATFKNSSKMLERGASKKLTLRNPGNYFFRVRAVDAAGKPVSSYSNTQSFEYSKELEQAPMRPLPIAATPPPAPVAEIPREVAAIPPAPAVKPDLGINGVPPPTLRDPNNNTSVVAFGQSPVFLNFRWRPVEGAVRYKIEISSSPEFNLLLAEYKTGETNYFFEKNLPAGTLYWRVRAEFANEATNWSQPNSFTVSYK